MEKTVKLNHYKFNYRATGNSANLPILFLHGFMGDCNDFNEAISFLSQDFYCLAVDLPGHGKTKAIGGEKFYTMEYTARALIGFLDVLKVDRCILMGYSMGGRLALYLALHFPKYFHKAILESTSPGLKIREERDKRIQSDLTLAKELESEDFLFFLKKWYNQPLFLSIKKHPSFVRMLESRLQNNPLELSKSLRNLSTGIQPSLWEKLRENSVPLLLLVGELDRKFVDLNTEMSSSCEFARLEIVGRCGHNIHLENVNLFVQRIRNFLTLERPNISCI